MQRELAQQRTVELKVGQEWNATLKQKKGLRNPEILDGFFAEVKKRLVKKYGSICAAFKDLDKSGDGSLSFLEFVDMLSQINLPLDQRSGRNLFDKASRGDRSLSLEEMKTMLLGKTIKRLKFIMDGFNSKQQRVQAHIHRFVRKMALGDEDIRICSIDRFQRKLTPKFANEIFKVMRAKKSRNGLIANDHIDRSTFTDVVVEFVTEEKGTHLLAYEIQFMLRIFDRVDYREQGSASIPSIATAMLLLGAHTDRLLKATSAFDFFDSDEDGCLRYEEVLELFLCICAQRLVVEVSLRQYHARDFQDELVVQEARRAYELALWHFERSRKIEGCIVTKREFVKALEGMPMLLDCLIPGAVRMRWALDSSKAEGERPQSPI